MNLLLTHTDLDGVAAWIVGRYYGIDFQNVIFIDYSNLYGEQEEMLDWFAPYSNQHYDKLWVTDVAVTPEMYDYIQKTFSEFAIFDHHERSLVLDGRPSAYVAKTSSGTKLFYDYLNGMYPEKHNVVLEEFVTLVDTYDRYDDKSPLWEQAQNMNRIFWQSLAFYKSGAARYFPFLKLQENKFYNFAMTSFVVTPYEQTLIEKSLAKEQQEYNLALRSLQIREDERGVKYGLWHGASKISIICYHLLQNYPDLTYIIAVNTYSGKAARQVNGKISVRSRADGDFDVTTLQGIGGHKSAGGGSLDIGFLKKFWFDKTVHIPYV